MTNAELMDEIRTRFLGAVGECDCNNDSAARGLDAIADLLDEAETLPNTELTK